MSDTLKRSAILIFSGPGHPRCEALEQAAEVGDAPRHDYVELAHTLNADIIDGSFIFDHAHPLSRSIVRWMGIPQAQVLEVWMRRKRYHHILLWHDRFGLTLGLLLKCTRTHADVVLLSAYLASPKRSLAVRLLRTYSSLRAIALESSEQKRIAVERLGIPNKKLHLFLPGVDDRFWRPQDAPVGHAICSVGAEARDYTTLIEAVRGLDVDVDLVPGSALVPDLLPPRVRVHEKLSWLQLRDVYAFSRFVVVPTHDVEYNAGITSIKEAMAMGKAVVLSRSKGQADYVRDGIHGLYVPPGDPEALSVAMQYLLNHPEEAEKMGQAGRALIEEYYTLDTAIARLAAIVQVEVVMDTP